MVGEEHDGVALEERVRTARRIEQRANGRVGLLEGVVGCLAFRTTRVRGEVEAGEVEGEEVEAVARDEPAPDRGGVGVDRTRAAAAHRERRSRPVRLEQAVKKEPMRPVRRAADTRERRQVSMATAVAGDVHGSRDETGVLERLVDRHGVPGEVALVHVEDRVEHRLRQSGCA